MDTRETIIALAYLVSAVLFILGIKGLTHPRTAVRGNMDRRVAACCLPLLSHYSTNKLSASGLIGITGIVIGAAIGSCLGSKDRNDRHAAARRAVQRTRRLCISFCCRCGTMEQVPSNGRPVAAKGYWSCGCYGRHTLLLIVPPANTFFWAFGRIDRCGYLLGKLSCLRQAARNQGV